MMMIMRLVFIMVVANYILCCLFCFVSVCVVESVSLIHWGIRPKGIKEGLLLSISLSCYRLWAHSNVSEALVITSLDTDLEAPLLQGGHLQEIILGAYLGE